MSLGTGTPELKGEALAHQDPAVVASILAAAVDVTVLMTPDGVICDHVHAAAEMPQHLFTGWPGKGSARHGDGGKPHQG